MQTYLVVELSSLDGLSGILRPDRCNMVGLNTKVFFLFRICIFLELEHNVELWFTHPSRSPELVCRSLRRLAIGNHSDSGDNVHISQYCHELTYEHSKLEDITREYDQSLAERGWCSENILFLSYRAWRRIAYLSNINSCRLLVQSNLRSFCLVTQWVNSINV